MKKTIPTALMGALLSSAVAHADYQCTSHDNTLRLAVNENHFTHLGDTSVTPEAGDEQKHYYGIVQDEGGPFLQKKVVKFYPFQGENILTIFTKPEFCGRGSCDYDAGPIISADLKLGEEHTYFSCNHVP